MKILRTLILLTHFTVLSGLVTSAEGQSFATHDTPKGAPQLVIIDTDIGDDIDDAFALALALRSPELRILGVTTTFGDTELRARLLDRYLVAVGRRDIPVSAGPATQSKGTLSQAAYALHSPRRAFSDGAEFILDQIRRHPGEITLIAIGPLSTVQAAISRAPSTFRKLKRVVMMGGSIYIGYDNSKTGVPGPPSSEWNIHADPAGAKALLASGVPVFMMPLDATQIRLPLADQETIFAQGSQLTDQLTLLYHEWSGPGALRTPTLYDPVTVAFATHPELCPVSPLRIEVDDQGFTRPVKGAVNAQVCLKADEEGFLTLMMDRVLRP